jgi:hypothetical protein
MSIKTTTLSPAEANALLGKEWFSSTYTDEVALIEGNLEWKSEHYTMSGVESGNEYYIVKGDVNVRGELDLGGPMEGGRSVIVIDGNLSAGRIILGDAVMMVTGTVTAREWIFGAETEGIFEVAGAQIEGSETEHAKYWAHLNAPIISIFNRKTWKTELLIDGVKRNVEELPFELEDNGRWRNVNDNEIRARLEAGKPLF